MYVSIGQNCLVLKKNILGVFDIENTTESADTRAFLSAAQLRGQVVYITEDLPRSFILYHESGKTTVYITPFSAATLRKRFNSKQTEFN